MSNLKCEFRIAKQFFLIPISGPFEAQEFALFSGPGRGHEVVTHIGIEMPGHGDTKPARGRPPDSRGRPRAVKSKTRSRKGG